MLDYFRGLNDKIKHFLVSAALIVFFMFILQGVIFDFVVFGVEFSLNDRAISLLSVVAIGIGKEAYDHFIGSTGFDWFDLIADFAGIFAGFVLWHIFLAAYLWLWVTL